MRLLAIVVLWAAAASMTGCSQASAPFSARSPAISSPAEPCRASLDAFADVSGAGDPDDRLVSSTRRPSGGTVCEYGSVFAQGPGPSHSLIRSTELDRSAADSLATAAAGIALGSGTGAGTACPADSGTVTVITFDYRQHRRVDLWWLTSGCQSIDNGRVEAQQLENPSFGHLQTVFAHVVSARARVSARGAAAGRR